MSLHSLPWADKQVTVAVLGDIMLDEYLDGGVTRISPEAPVPIHLVTSVTHRPGGAGNAALNVVKAGGRAEIFGVWGADEAARDLMGILHGAGVGTKNIVVDDKRPTIKKTRITANHQQIVRVDWEKVQPLSLDIENQLFERLASGHWQVLLVSDYGKGGLSSDFLKRVIAEAQSRRASIVIDPKGTDYSRYAGADVITPNRNEACLALGLDPTDRHDKEDLAAGLQEAFGLGNVLLTLGPDGMYLRPSGDEPDEFLPARARDVYDVSGAGDTVAAVFALSLAAGASKKDAMYLANMAAGVVVGKWGTFPIEKDELLHELKNPKISGRFSTTIKLRSREELLKVIGDVKGRNRRIVFTNGCFDILHAGHVAYLEKARSLGDALVIGVNSDRSVREIKGEERPVVEASQRKQLLAALACVDYVVEFDEATPEALINFLVPDVLVKGADWDLDQIVGRDTVEKAGGRVDHIDLIPGISTSEIIRRVKSGRGVDL